MRQKKIPKLKHRKMKGVKDIPQRSNIIMVTEILEAKKSKKKDFAKSNTQRSPRHLWKWFLIILNWHRHIIGGLQKTTKQFYLNEQDKMHYLQNSNSKRDEFQQKIHKKNKNSKISIREKNPFQPWVLYSMKISLTTHFPACTGWGSRPWTFARRPKMADTMRCCWVSCAWGGCED